MRLTGKTYMVDPVDIIKTHKHDKVAGLRVEGLGVGQAAVKTFQLKNNSKLAKKCILMAKIEKN